MGLIIKGPPSQGFSQHFPYENLVKMIQVFLLQVGFDINVKWAV